MRDYVLLGTEITERSRDFGQSEAYAVSFWKMITDNYECAGQMNIFDLASKPIRIAKPIRLIELFAGYGSQAMALKRIGAKFEHYRVVEFDKYAIASYNAVHGTDFPTMDITKVHAEDLNICDTNAFTYLLTYLLIPLYGFISCWKASRNEQGKWDKIGSFVGS